MKRLLPCLLFLLALTGCGDTSKAKLSDMNKSYIHFAANLLLDDVSSKGDASVFSGLLHDRVLNPQTMLEADQVIEEFRKNFPAAEDRYYALRNKGTLVHGKVDHIDRERREVIFSRQEKSGATVFSGTLRLSMSKDFYTQANMPDYAPGTPAAFMCRDYRPVHDFRNAGAQKVEVRLIQCMTIDAYYAHLQNRIQEQLERLYSGKDAVSPEMAKQLAALYMAGNLAPKNSPCFSEDLMACRKSLTDELRQKLATVKIEDTTPMQLDPESGFSHKFPRELSEPSVRPENANRSPSGERLHEQPAHVKEKKQALSQVKVPSAR